MIDKIWYDWQNKSPRNKYSYGGGSVTPVPSFVNFTKFPTGLPPYLNVSASSDLKQACVILGSHVFLFVSQFDSEVPGDGLWSNITVWDVMDTTGGKLCFIYV